MSHFCQRWLTTLFLVYVDYMESNWVEVDPGLRFPSRFRVYGAGTRRGVNVGGEGDTRAHPLAISEGSENFGDAGTTLMIWVAFNRETLAYEAEQVSLFRDPEGPPISGSSVRAIRFQEALSWGVARAVRTAAGSPEIGLLVAGDMTLDEYKLHLEASWREFSRDEIAAQVYVIARAFGVPPLKRVAEVLGVSQSTATRLIARARDEGVLR